MDTRGQAYNKALQQFTTGVYLAELCLIGLMSIATNSSPAAIGPLVLMVVFLILTIVYHFLLNRAISELSDDIADDFCSKTNSPKDSDEETGLHEKMKNISSTAGKYSQKYSNLLVRLMHIPSLPPFEKHLTTPFPVYAKDEEEEAYINPSVTSPRPLVWAVHDNVGIVEREKKAFSDVIEVTDEGAWWDEKTGKLTTLWSGRDKQVKENVLQSAPLWKRKIHY